MGWNPFSWFNNRGGGGMSDGANEEFFDKGGWKETVFDGGPDITTTYNSMRDYDNNNPSGSYNWGGGYKSSWSDAFRAADKWNQGQKGGYNYPGYMSSGPNWPNKGSTKLGNNIWSGSTRIGNNSTLVNTTAPWWNDYKVIQSQPKQGSGIGGMIGNIVGTAAGSTLGPLGAKIGGSIGGSIGSSF